MCFRKYLRPRTFLIVENYMIKTGISYYAEFFTGKVFCPVLDPSSLGWSATQTLAHEEFRNTLLLNPCWCPDVCFYIFIPHSNGNLSMFQQKYWLRCMIIDQKWLLKTYVDILFHGRGRQQMSFHLWTSLSILALLHTVIQETVVFTVYSIHNN